MNILILRDSRPGHFNQSEGVAKALGRLQPVEITRLSLSVPGWIHGRTMRRLFRLCAINPSFALWMFHGVELSTIEKPDVIVSAGGDTLAANALLARHFDVANLFIGSLRETPETDFSAILTIYPSIAPRRRHILTAKPPPFDPECLEPPRLIASMDDVTGARAALFVGGPSGSHDWADDDWEQLQNVIGALSDRFGLEWTITNSRRTPDVVSAQLQAFSHSHMNVRTFVDAREAGTPPLEELFGADILLVTEDSATMMMEAVAARRPVIALSPKQRRPSRDDEAVGVLEDDNRLKRLPLAQITPDAIAEAAAGIVPLSENPLDTLAGKLQEVLDLNDEPTPSESAD